jgi:hypothetical protein
MSTYNYTKPISPSGLKLYKTCPRQWADRYVLGNKPPERAQSNRGTDLHLELELFFTGAQPYPVSNRALRPWQRFMENLSIIPHTTEGEVAVRKDWTATTFNDPEANYRGKYDLKLNGDSSVLDVFDWKSGKIYPDHESQGLSYCAMEPGEFQSYRTHFVYLDIPTHVETRVYAGPRIVQERSVLSDTIEFVRLDTEYRPTPSPACNWCHLSWRKGGSCRAAR